MWTAPLPRRFLPVLRASLCLYLFGSAATAWCATVLVAPPVTIQSAISSAADGDTILVGPGTYSENINFLGKAITLMSSSGPEATIIQGDGSGPVVTFDQEESRAALLTGFTITGGERGILVSSAEPVIRGNVIRDNGPRGGLKITYYPVSSGAPQMAPLILENWITANYSDVGSSGIYALGDLAAEIVNNVISENTTSRGDGGGIRAAVTEGGLVIRDNLVVDNEADDHGGGMDIAIVSSGASSRRIEITGNIIAHNIAYGREKTVNGGGGLRLFASTGPVTNNTFVGNAAYGVSWFGGHLAVESPDPLTVEVSSNIFADAEWGYGVGAYRQATVNARNNIFWNNFPEDLVTPDTGVIDEEDNIYANPLLCDPDGGDYSVSVHSPALSAPGGLIGAVATPGCSITPVKHTSWGKLKTLYR